VFRFFFDRFPSLLIVVSDVEDVEEENPYCEGCCDVCGQRFHFHYGTTKTVICEWIGGETEGCGKVITGREMEPAHVNARNAALTFVGLARLRRNDNALLKSMGKDVASIVAKFVWSSRNDPQWRHQQDAAEPLPVARFVRSKSWFSFFFFFFFSFF
jgi:hypothetical protein